jgi:hypothetical protein
MPFCILEHLTVFTLAEQKELFPAGVLPWHAVCASKRILAAVRNGLLTVQNLQVKLSNEGGFNSVFLMNYGLNRWKAKELPITSIDIDVYVSCADLTWYRPGKVRDGFDERRIKMFRSVCEKLFSHNRNALKELKLDLAGDIPSVKAFEASIRVIPDLPILTTLAIQIPRSNALTLCSLSAIKCLTALTSLSYVGDTVVRSEDNTTSVLFDFLSTRLETLAVHDYVNRMCADVVHPFVVSAFASRVSADGFAALRVLKYKSGEAYIAPSSLVTFLDAVAKLPKLTDFNYYADRNHYRELQVPHIRRLILQRPDVRVVFADSDEV